MVELRAGEWANGWASFDMSPPHAGHAERVLACLAAEFGAAVRAVDETGGTESIDFTLEGAPAAMLRDAATLTFGFARTETRDHVLAALRSLPPGFWWGD